MCNVVDFFLPRRERLSTVLLAYILERERSIFSSLSPSSRAELSLGISPNKFWDVETIKRSNLLVNPNLLMRWKRLDWLFVCCIKTESLKIESELFEQTRQLWFWVIVERLSEFDVRSMKKDIQSNQSFVSDESKLANSCFETVSLMIERVSVIAENQRRKRKRLRQKSSLMKWIKLSRLLKKKIES